MLRCSNQVPTSTMTPATRPGTDPADTDAMTGRIAELSRTMLEDVRLALQDIDSINRTVHILSMNARVEAARAGTAGAGFSVVAQELARLSAQTQDTTRAIGSKTGHTGAQLQGLAQQVSGTVADTRLCDLAHHAMDLVDRNLYERSCDVRWWATDAALVACAGQAGDAAHARHAARRLGQILDSYTVYADLLLVGLDGRVLCNGRPQAWPRTAGADAAAQPWFRDALAQRRGDVFAFQPVHACPYVGGERALVYACGVREGGRVDGRLLGVLGIVFRWDALGVQVLQAMPLTARERSTTRACIVDGAGTVMADADPARIGQVLRFDGLEALLRGPRGAITTQLEGRRVRACHARAPGFETYTTGWHGLLLQAV